jgi:hypothetical protein
MRRIARRLPRLQSPQGFSLVEVLVGGLVLVVGLIMISQFFASAAARVLESDIRSVLHQVATEELEAIRGLEYTDVGTQGGWPRGDLLDVETREVENLTVKIEREVIFWTDDSYTGPYYANYRRVTVRVSAVGHEALQPVEVTSNVAGGAEGGTILVRVQDSHGDPVGSVQLQIKNENLIPSINIHSSAIRTNSDGLMMIPGLPVDDSGSYVVSGAKAGYNADSKTGFPVLDGTCQEVILTMDRLSTMVIRTVDSTGAPVGNLAVAVTGPQSYSNPSVVCDANGVATLSNLCFSLNGEAYYVALVEGQGYSAVTQEVNLPADATHEVVLTVAADGTSTTTTSEDTTTTTDPAVTTTTDPSATTTTQSTTTTEATTTTLGSNGVLRVTVRSSDGNRLIRGAWVSLEGNPTGATNRDGYVVFSNLALRTYTMTITAQYHETYTGTVTVTGNNAVTITLTKNGSPPPPH